MTRRTLVAVGLLICASVLGIAAHPASYQTAGRAGVPGSTVSGAVVTKDGSAVRRATIELEGPQGTRSTETDDQGRFRLADVTAGVYRLFASKPAWLKTEYGATVLGGVGQPIEMAKGADLQARLVLTRGGVLTGVIRDISGAPVPDVIVGASLGPVSHEVWTNDQGEYRIYGLPPGEYLVAAVPHTYVAKLASPAVVMSAAQVDSTLTRLRARQSGSGGTPTQAARSAPSQPVSLMRGFAPVFYPGTVSDDLATKIPVSEGAEISGLDFTLFPMGTSMIKGTIVSALDAKTANRVFVTVARAGRNQTAVRPSVTAAGTFEVTNLVPGRYVIEARQTLIASRSSAAGASTGDVTRAQPYAAWASSEVDVGPGETPDVTVVMQPPLTFSGRVTIDPADQGSRQLGAGVSLSLFRLTSPANEAPVAAAAVRADGQFVLTGFGAGSYRLVANAPAAGGSWRLKSVVVDGHERLDPVFEFPAANGKVQGAIVTLTARHTELSGTLTTTTQTAATLYRIIAFSADAAMWRPGSRRVAMTTPDRSGHFAFADLPAGDYLLAVLAGPDAAWQTPEFLTRVASSAAKVTVDESGRSVQDLAIAAQASAPR